MNVPMHLRRAILAVLAIPPLLAVPHSSTPAAAQTARKSRPTAATTNAACLARALGGMESIARFSTIYTRYEVEIGGVKGTDIFVRDVRGAFRRGLDVPGVVTELTVFDGAKGWRRGTDGVVHPLSGVQFANAVTEAYLGTFMHVVPGRIPGTVERVGLDRASGLVKLRVSPQGGTPVTLFLDTLTCLPARMEQGAGDARATFHLRDWRTVSGIKLAHSIRRSVVDTARDARITLLEARFDVPLPAGAFAKPAAVAPKPAEVPKVAEPPKPSEPPKAAEAPKPAEASGSQAVELPFDLVGNKPYLDVKVGNHAMSFQFDTGMRGMMIDRDRAEAIGLVTGAKFQSGGAGEGSLEHAFANDVDFSIGSLPSRAMRFTVAPLAGVSTAEGRAIAGLIGYEFAHRFVVEIDYEARRLRFHDPAGWSYAVKDAGVPFTVMQGGYVLVRATIAVAPDDSVTGRFIVDTGARHGLVINRPFAEKHRLAKRLSAGPEGTIGFGMGGESRGRVARALALRIGGLEFSQPVVVLSVDKKGSLASGDFDGIVGGELLRRCRVIFDHPRERLLLEPNAAFAAPFDYDMSGLFLLAEGDDFTRFLVRGVLEGSPSSAAGLAGGDEITSVDGRPAAKLTLEEIRRTLRSGEREVALGIRRGDKSLTVRLKLKRMV